MSIMMYMEGNRTSGLHSLSDEVLLEICAYLSSEDLLSLSQTNIKFNDLLCDRVLMRQVNFRAAYSLSIDKLKLFFQPKIRCQNIHTLSLSSCYWLTSRDIFWAIQRLDALENLHVDDTELSIKHLISILSSNKKIRSLSWTFNMTNKDGSNDVNSLAKNFLEMKNLNLWVNYVGVHYLTLLLQHCTSLEGLRLSPSRCEEMPYRGTYWRNTVVFQLPSLKSLVLSLPEPPSSVWVAFAPLLFHACGTTRLWHTFWLDCSRIVLRVYHGTEDFRPFEKFGSAYALSNPLLNDWDLMFIKNMKYYAFEHKYPCNSSLDLRSSGISHLVWRCDFWPECFPAQLQHLCIKCVNFVSSQTSFASTTLTLEPLMNLTTLSAPACIFLRSSSGVGGKMEKDTLSGKGEGRQSLINKEPDKSCILNQFLRVAPNLKHLNLTCEWSTYCKSNGPRIVEIGNLLVIQQWTQLESLFLENMTLVDISPLFQICSCFPKLRRLGLRNMGINGTFPRSRELGQTIIKLEFLEDFRFEHPVVEKLSDIYEALSQTTKIRRIAILCKRTNVKQNIHEIVDIVKKCPLLTFLYILLPSFTHIDCKGFQKSVKTLYKNKHNHLWARIEGMSESSIQETCPKIHFSEMIKSNHLNITPPLLYNVI